MCNIYVCIIVVADSIGVEMVVVVVAARASAVAMALGFLLKSDVCDSRQEIPTGYGFSILPFHPFSVHIHELIYIYIAVLLVRTNTFMHFDDEASSSLWLE